MPINSLIGRDTQHPLERYANETILNNHNCFVDSQVDACEDVKIHFVSGIAFLACDSPAVVCSGRTGAH